MFHSSLSRLVAASAVAGVLFVSAGAAQAQCSTRIWNRGCMGNRAIFMPACADQAPRPRARIVSRAEHASPDFLLPTGPVITRTVGDRNEVCRLSPTRFGLPAGTEIRIPVRVGWVVVPMDPFTRLDAESHSAFRLAQDRWLLEQGLVGKARIVRRADSLPEPEVSALNDRVMTAEARPELPKPRATLKLHRPPIQKKGKFRLEARLDASGERVTLISSNHPLAAGNADDRLASLTEK